MESLVDLLPLLFVGAYYLLAGRRRAKLKKAQRERDTAPQEELVSDAGPREPSPFRSFLDQIEGAMAEAAGEPSPADQPRPVTAPAGPPPAVSAPVSSGPSLAGTSPSAPALDIADAEFTPVSGSFDSRAPVDHVAHGFGADNPLSEEAFERASAFGGRRAPSAAERRSYDPHGLQPARTSPPADWRRRLSDPQAARDAFVLQTVFGPRGGRRAEHRR